MTGGLQMVTMPTPDSTRTVTKSSSAIVAPLQISSNVSDAMVCAECARRRGCK